MSSNDLFTISIHALERFQERFPELWRNDEQAGHLIHGEAMDAYAQGRSSYVAPLELAHNDLSRWEAGKSIYVWLADKTRGYVLLETPEGWLVLTVLKGKTPLAARQMLYGGRPRK